MKQIKIGYFEIHDFVDEDLSTNASEKNRNSIDRIRKTSFKVNKMIVNPQNFQSIKIDRNGKTKNPSVKARSSSIKLM